MINRMDIMAEVDDCNVNNTLLFESAFSVNDVKEEESQDEDSGDDKVQISETAVVTGNTVFQNQLICDKVKRCDTSAAFDNIKTEQGSPEEISSKVHYDMIHHNLKTERGTSPNDMKLELNNGLLYCEHCRVYYEDYCADCEMLVHILNRTVPVNADNTSPDELPSGNILEIQHYLGEFHVFALKVIPEGVKFGPFTGLHGTEHAWKVKGGKFVADKDKAAYINWMQYIGAARNISEQNLLAFQHEGNLYYQSTCRIQKDHELLVYFGEDYEDSLNRNVEMSYVPVIEHNFKGAFACTFCCLGFSSKAFLIEHKRSCPANADGTFSLKELTQCPSCTIHIDQEEYILHHMAYCFEKSDRKCILPTPDNRATVSNGPQTQPHLIFERQQCQCTTRYRGDLETYADAHRKAKVYECGLCCGRYKAKEVLALHVESTDTRADEKDDLERLCSPNEMEQLKCSLCEFHTKHKTSLKRHVALKHLKKFSYKCDRCDYKTNLKFALQQHTKARHLKQFKYKCETCDHKTCQKSELQNHIEAIHLKEYRYKCDVCDYRANLQSALKEHIKTRHLKLFKYKCDDCDYETNRKSSLEKHSETKHLRQFKYKCDLCDYKANQRYHLKRHVETAHLKEFKHKCDTCDYKANQKSDLKKHIEARHLREFKYKCDVCDYKANLQSRLKQHTRTIHLKQFKYKCDTCYYKTNREFQLKSHIESKHLNLSKT